MKRFLFLSTLVTLVLSACQTAGPAVAPTQPPAATVAPATKLPEPTPAGPAVISKVYGVPCAKDCIWKIGGEPNVYRGPGDVVVDRQGNIFVSDSIENTMLKFDPAGKLLAKWGATGSDDGQFQKYMFLAADKDGNVYVTDTGNFRVQKFDPNGKFLMKFGSIGMGDDQFMSPRGLAVDEQGNIYVGGATANEGIKKFDSSGKFVARWGKPANQFNNVFDITVDQKGNFYVADFNNFRVVKLDPQGNPLAVMDSCAGKGEAKQPLEPWNVAVDATGNVHVGDATSGQVCVYSPDGQFQSTWGKDGTGEVNWRVVSAMAFDPQGNLVTSDGVACDIGCDAKQVEPGHIWKLNKK